MNTRSSVGIAVLMTLALASCGKSPPAADGAAQPAPAPTPPAPSAATAALPAPAARDVASLRACEIVKPAEVASIVGGPLLNEPPPGFANCAYVIEIAGRTESYRLMFSEPGVYAVMLEAQTPEEKGERIDGLWDEAYVQPGMGAGVSVIVLRRGDLALEVKGDRREPALEIARLAASRVN